MPGPLVTRNMLWFYAGDIPYVDFCYKGIQFFFNFSKSLTYCTPHGEALWPGGSGAAKEDGIDLEIPDWSWWIVADDMVEFSCSKHGIHGNFLALNDMTKGIQITIPVNPQQAKSIYESIKEMIDNADEKLTLDRDLLVLKPSYKVIAYPVKAYRWTTPSPRKTKFQFIPEWNPDMRVR